ncbi:META domain-containing protein [Acetobacter sp. DmW_136]|uniref:META domain-containing protein n=1 Tax=Acetobacter sp. DmW_136 TaxID=2591091 RepID=UPI001239B40F|nr:META domain-containing protein [Acetobacter sp. DmW_136]KAA8384359.1 META domain-containing protein [Acetobacter sp. DmW_136]
MRFSAPFFRSGLFALCAAGAVLAGCADPRTTTTPEGKEAPVAATGPKDVYEARGNAPFWNMTLADGALSVETPDGPRMARVIRHAYSEGGTRYYEASDIKAALTASACTDNMTGQVFTDTVTLTTATKTLRGCGGALVPPTSLNNTRWVVTAMDGRKLRSGNFVPDTDDSATDENPNPAADMFAPTLDINDTGKISGSDGCNRYVGGLVFGPKGSVKATPVGSMSTRMACLGKQNDIANTFSPLLNSVTGWTTDGTHLVLQTSGGKTIRLRQVF